MVSRLSEKHLDSLSALGIHEGRGKRLSDMTKLYDILPEDFRLELEALGFNPVPNRAVGFVKSKRANWSLPWHQDRVIAMAQKSDNPAYKNWSRKSGLWHCEPCTDILEQTAFAYIAFDPLNASSGGLQIAERSHLLGQIPQADIPRCVESSNIVLPTLERGDVLIVSALALHRSASTSKDTPRRTFRIDFAKTGVTFP